MRSCSVLVRIDLTGHDHHPHQEHTAHNPEREFRLPALTCSMSLVSCPSSYQERHALTDILLLQKRKRIPTRSAHTFAKHIRVALIVDIGACKQLNRSADDACDEEDKQDEGEQHHGAGQKLALRNEDDFNEDEDYG
jgi:hypothetical protein